MLLDMRCNLCQNPVNLEKSLLFVKDGFEIVKCSSCGLVFRYNLPSQTELIGLYGNDYFVDNGANEGGQGYFDYLEDEAFHRLNARRRIIDIESLYPVRGAILDVGCAAGFFLDEARMRGWQVTGMEIAEVMAGWAKSNLGLKIVTESFQQADLAERSFDVITMWDYLEHSVDPLGDVEKSHNLLKKDGLLVISTGDISSLTAKIFGKRWHLLTPQHHNFYFSKNTLRSFAEKSGFQTIKIVYETNFYPLRYLAHKLKTLGDWRVISWLESKFRDSKPGALAIPVNLFDIITLYAKKN